MVGGGVKITINHFDLLLLLFVLFFRCVRAHFINVTLNRYLSLNLAQNIATLIIVNACVNEIYVYNISYYYILCLEYFDSFVSLSFIMLI